jgi:hypothetical protein
MRKTPCEQRFLRHQSSKKQGIFQAHDPKSTLSTLLRWFTIRSGYSAETWLTLAISKHSQLANPNCIPLPSQALLSASALRFHLGFISPIARLKTAERSDIVAVAFNPLTAGFAAKWRQIC